MNNVFLVNVCLVKISEKLNQEDLVTLLQEPILS